jgi:hypothetical protein
MVLLIMLTSVSNKVAMAAARSLRVLAAAERLANVEEPVEENSVEKEGIRRSLYDQLGDPKALMIGVSSNSIMYHPTNQMIQGVLTFRNGSGK